MQKLEEIERFYQKEDPWGFTKNFDDIKRKKRLIEEIFCLPLPLQPVLDIGCGEGFITNDIPSSQVYGMDISYKAIERAKKNNPLNRYFVWSINEEIPDKIPSFDLVIVTGVLYRQYVGGFEDKINENLNALVRPNKYLMMSHIKDWLYFPIKPPFNEIKFFDYPYREYIQHFQLFQKVE